MDSRWNISFMNATNILKLDKTQSEHFANAAKRIREIRAREAEQKKLNQTKVLTVIPRYEHSAASMKMCRATLMNNKPCSSRATCGEFCRRHRLVN